MLKHKNNPEEQQKKLTSGLKRQLSVFYIAPDGRLTSDDPNSYKGEERVAYQNVLISQHPDTGYAKGILRERQEKKAPGFFQTVKQEESDKSAASIPTPS